MKLKLKKVVCAAFPYDLTASVEENVQSMASNMDDFIEEVTNLRINKFDC